MIFRSSCVAFKRDTLISQVSFLLIYPPLSLSNIFKTNLRKENTSFYLPVINLVTAAGVHYSLGIVQEMLLAELSYCQESKSHLSKEIEMLTEQSTVLLSLFTRQEDILEG